MAYATLLLLRLLLPSWHVISSSYYYETLRRLWRSK